MLDGPTPDSNAPRPKVIAIMGTPLTSGNRGVLALGASLLNLFWQVAPGSEFVFLLVKKDNRPASFRLGGVPHSIPVVNARRTPRTAPQHHFAWIFVMSLIYGLIPLGPVRRAIKRSTPWIKTVAEADLVGTVHGGDSFSDIYGLRRLIEIFLLEMTIVFVRGSIVQFPQTYGPYKTASSRWMARRLLRRSSIIVARDKESRQIARELAPEHDIQLSPDVAFSLEPIRPAQIALDPPLGQPLSAPVIGLNVNGLMYNGGYTGKNMFGLKMEYRTFLPQLVEALLREHPGELWLIPHTFAPDGDVESDPESSRILRASLAPELQRRIRIVSHPYDQYEIKGVIGQCDFFVGSRMHACIAALSQGVPCVGVAYSMKFAGVFESVGMESWVVDGRKVTNDEAVARVMECFRSRQTVRTGLAARAEEARRQLRQVFRELVDSTDQSDSNHC